MSIKLLSPVLLSLIATSLIAQGLKVNPGTVLKTSAGINIVIENGGLINNGNGDFSNSNLYVTGDTKSTIGGISETTVSNLYINKSATPVVLQNDLHVTNNVVFQKGLLNLSGHNLLLSPVGSLVGETESSHVTGALGGYVSVTVNLNAPSGANPGNLGAWITSSKNLGAVVVQRGHNSQMNSGSGKSILRYFNIQPSKNTALNAVLRFTYLDKELNSLTESELSMWKSTNSGTSWTKVTASDQNAALNFIEISNVNVLSRYTLSSPSFTLANSELLYAAKNVIKDKIFDVTIAPNPASLQTTITIISKEAFRSHMDIFNADGHKVMQQPLYLNAGINRVNTDVHSLMPGAYYVVVKMKDGGKKTIPLIKQ